MLGRGVVEPEHHTLPLYLEFENKFQREYQKCYEPDDGKELPKEGHNFDDFFYLHLDRHLFGYNGIPVLDFVLYGDWFLDIWFNVFEGAFQFPAGGVQERHRASQIGLEYKSITQVNKVRQTGFFEFYPDKGVGYIDAVFHMDFLDSLDRDILNGPASAKNYGAGGKINE